MESKEQLFMNIIPYLTPGFIKEYFEKETKTSDPFVEDMYHHEYWRINNGGYKSLIKKLKDFLESKLHPLYNLTRRFYLLEFEASVPIHEVRKEINAIIPFEIFP